MKKERRGRRSSNQSLRGLFILMRPTNPKSNEKRLKKNKPGLKFNNAKSAFTKIHPLPTRLLLLKNMGFSQYPPLSRRYLLLPQRRVGGCYWKISLKSAYTAESAVLNSYPQPSRLLLSGKTLALSFHCRVVEAKGPTSADSAFAFWRHMLCKTQ